MSGIQPSGRRAPRVPPRLLPTTTFVAAVLVGCAGTSQPPMVVPTEARAGDAVLAVTNRHPHDVEILARNEHQSETKLATLRVHWNRELRLPRTMNGTHVELIVRCLETGEIYRTRDIVWYAREQFAFSLEEMLPTSRLVRR